MFIKATILPRTAGEYSQRHSYFMYINTDTIATMYPAEYQIYREYQIPVVKGYSPFVIHKIGGGMIGSRNELCYIRDADIENIFDR